MISLFSNFPALIPISFLVLMGLIAVSFAMARTWDIRSSRLRPATLFDDLNERNELLDRQLAQKQDELRIAQQKISEADRLTAEVAALTERIRQLEIERAGLAEAERQIEETKRRAAEAAAEYSEVADSLQKARADLDEIAQARTVLEREVEALKRKLEDLRKAIDEETIRERNKLPDLTAEVERLQAAKDRLDSEMAELRATRGSILAEREAAEAASARLRQMQAEAPLLEERVADLKEEQETLAGAINRLRLDLAVKDAERQQVEALVARRAALEAEITRLEANRKADVPGTPEADVAVVLNDLKEVPGFLRNPNITAKALQTEDEALHDVRRALQNQKLEYDDRTVLAFHTALKINDNAQMTVLAGVSGTGKSLLPRQYSEAMGLNFLQIAVEPRWDSPQDLLGFYNYIEKRYRATELARALVHMDPFNTSKLCEKPARDQMLLVLLDEMNLARVEYYFSEFLSRLEVRPRRRGKGQEPGSEQARLDASLPLDIRIHGQKPIQLYPSHNVLFVGTMNDDESTQSLSDKVLDRSNVMQFSAPERFAKPAETNASAQKTAYRSFDAWQGWIRPIASLDGGSRDVADGVIQKLAEIMRDAGRPFGHRLNEAVLAYVANYPRKTSDPIHAPLADQVEFRILPKLRGLPIDGHDDIFDRLARVIREDLRDTGFADRMEEYVDRQRGQSGQFSWRGLSRA